MKSLFFRIFLSFWAALVLFIVLSTVVTIALNPARRGIESQAPDVLAEAVHVYHSGNEQALKDYLESVRNEHHVRLYIFDSDGKELAGRRVPRGLKTRGGKRSPRAPGWNHCYPTASGARR